MTDEVAKPSRTLYLRQIAQNFSGGVINPYVPVYAVQLGSNSSEMGWLRSLNNLFANAMQFPWGIACDRLGRYTPFIVLGGVVSSLLWLPALFISTPWQLISIVAVQALANSMVAPAWAALLGKILPKSSRASGTANMNAAAALGTVSATLLSGLVMSRVGGTLAEMYRLPLMIAAVTGVGASLAMLTIRERRQGANATTERRWFDWRSLGRNPNFRKFSMISIIHGFFMSIAWPLFPMTLVRITNGDMIQVAIVSTISGVVQIFARRYTGRISDRAGRKTLIVLGRAGIFVYPLLYSLATNVYSLYAAEFIIGILGSVADITIFAYLLDITTDEQRGASVAVYNTLQGFATFFGSILGGYLVIMFGATGLDPTVSMISAYMVSVIGRLGAGLLFTKISEEYPYPSSVRRELAEMMSEDVERTRYRIRKAEELGEEAEQDLIREMERFGTPPADDDAEHEAHNGSEEKR